MLCSSKFWPLLGVGSAFVLSLSPLALAVDLRYAATIARPTVTLIAQALPFPLDGKIVYVSRGGVWSEARLSGYRWNSTTGYLYTVTYLPNNVVEQNVPVSRIITLAEAQKRGVATKVYDLSTKAGVDQMLSAHNAVRKRYGIPPLTWSPQLATYAQTWASTLTRENRFAHRPNSIYGENLAYSRGLPLSPSAVVQMWANEVKDYTYATNTCRAGAICGHYTQLVWRKTTQVGCGMSRVGDREVWVCNYNPPGNVYGVKPY